VEIADSGLLNCLLETDHHLETESRSTVDSGERSAMRAWQLWLAATEGRLEMIQYEMIQNRMVKQR
jgi:hypothetical protein